MPEIVSAFPSITASAPTISCMYCVTGEVSTLTFGSGLRRAIGFASRLKAATKFAAVTRAPVWKRYVRLSSIVCVFPSFENPGKSAATSGVRTAPSEPGLSG